MSTQSTPTQTGITVSTAVTAGGIQFNHAEGIVVSPEVTAIVPPSAKPAAHRCCLSPADNRKAVTMLTKSITAIALASTALLAGAGSASAQLTSEPAFDTNKLAQAVDDQLRPNSVGFSFAISHQGKLVETGSGGFARTAVDTPGGVPFSPSTRMEIWSANKNITAAAVLKLLDAAGASTESAVAPFLPADWPRGTGFKIGDPTPVTFRMLLDHTSGLGQVGDNLTTQEQAQKLWSTVYDGVRYAVAKGTTPGSAYNYTNLNYAILANLIPRLWQIAEPTQVPGPLTKDNNWKHRLNYINTRLFSPIGIGPRNCDTNGPTATLHYDLANPSTPGRYVGLTGEDAEACAGHRGLHLSVLDMVRFETYLAHDAIIPGYYRSAMDAWRMGWNPTSNTGTRVGFYWHGGAGFLSQNRDGFSCISKLPNDIQAAVIINSSTTVDACRVLRAAYDAAT